MLVNLVILSITQRLLWLTSSLLVYVHSLQNNCSAYTWPRVPLSTIPVSFSSKNPNNLSKPVSVSSVQSLSRVRLCDPMNRSMPGLPVHHQLPEFTQSHVHCVGDAIQPSHLLSFPSPPAHNPSHHQGLFQWVSSSHQVAKVLEFQLQHQSFWWTPRTDLL